MRADMTNKEEAEFLKQWWHNYGKAILTAVIIGLGVGYGWRYWQQLKLNKATEASQIYQQLLVADKQGQPETTRAQLLGQLVKQYPTSSYTSLAQFLTASDDVSNQRYALAQKSYQWVVDQGRNKSLQQVARLRLAKIYLYQKQYQSALNSLATVNDKSYLPMVEGLRGDVYASQNKKQQALASYTKAEQGLHKLGVENPLIKLKMSSL